MDLAVVQIQALVKQTQYRYLMAYGLELAKPLVCPPERMETAENGNGNAERIHSRHRRLGSANDAEAFPSFTLFQPNVKRVCRRATLYFSQDSVWISRNVAIRATNTHRRTGQVMSILACRW